MTPEGPVEGLLIRPIARHEATPLSELALRSKAHWGYSDEFLDACRDELSVRPDSNCAYFCAQLGDRIAGFYGLAPLDDNRVELEALFVEPEMIGHGVGRSLLEHAIARASNIGASRMLIQGDPHAEKFYCAAGAVRVGERQSGSIPGRTLPLFEIPLEA